MELSAILSMPQQLAPGGGGAVSADATSSPQQAGEMSLCFFSLFQKFSGDNALSQQHGEIPMQQSSEKQKASMTQKLQFAGKLESVACGITGEHLQEMVHNTSSSLNESSEINCNRDDIPESDVESDDNDQESGENLPLSATSSDLQPPMAAVVPLATPEITTLSPVEANLESSNLVTSGESLTAPAVSGEFASSQPFALTSPIPKGASGEGAPEYAMQMRNNGSTAPETMKAAAADGSRVDDGSSSPPSMLFERFRVEVVANLQPGERGEAESSAVKVSDLPLQKTNGADFKIADAAPGIAWGEKSEVVVTDADAFAPVTKEEKSHGEILPGNKGREGATKVGMVVAESTGEKKAEVNKDNRVPAELLQGEEAIPMQHAHQWALSSKGGGSLHSPKAVAIDPAAGMNADPSISMDASKNVDGPVARQQEAAFVSADAGSMARKAYGESREKGIEASNGENDATVIPVSGTDSVHSKAEVKNQIPANDGKLPFSEHIQQQVREKVEHGDFRVEKNSITLKLHPEELGELKINLRMDDQRLRVEVVAENHAVKEALMQNLDSLKESLSRQHISMERFNVSTEIRHDLQHGSRDGNRSMQENGGGYSNIFTPVIEENLSSGPVYGWENEESTLSLVL